MSWAMEEAGKVIPSNGISVIELWGHPLSGTSGDVNNSRDIRTCGKIIRRSNGNNSRDPEAIGTPAIAETTSSFANQGA